MIRNLKILGLALVALLAMSAMVASAASAKDFTIGSAQATVTADQQGVHKFTVTGQTVECKVVEFEGTPNATTFTSVKLAATYHECTGAFTALTITNFATDHSEIGNKGKCWYRVDAAGSAALECNAAEVTFGAAACAVHIPAQSFASGVTFSNVAGSNPHDVLAEFNITGLTATHTDGFLCPFGSSGHAVGAVLEGKSTVTAHVGGNQVSGTYNAT